MTQKPERKCKCPNAENLTQVPIWGPFISGYCFAVLCSLEAVT